MPFFALAYVSGGWFATHDVWHALKRGKADIQFLMVVVAVGALFIKGWTEGATLLFLFSLSNGWSSSQIIAHANRSSLCSKWRRNTRFAVKMVSG